MNGIVWIVEMRVVSHKPVNWFPYAEQAVRQLALRQWALGPRVYSSRDCARLELTNLKRSTAFRQGFVKFRVAKYKRMA